MADSLVNSLMETYSVRRFITGITDDLTDGNSVICLLPVGISSTKLWSAVQQRLWQQSFSVREIILDSSESQTPIDELSNLLNVTWQPADLPRTLENLLHCLMKDGYPPDIIYLLGFEQVGKSDRWQLLIRNWAAAVKSLMDRGALDGKTCTALCLLVPAQVQLQGIESDIYLKVHWWWGFPSALEMHLLCREEVEKDTTRSVVRWREHVLSALACNDISLIERLWEKTQELTQENLVNSLNAFATDHQWTADLLKSWGADTLTTLNGIREKHTGQSPSTKWRQLWANGAIVVTTEYGVELHPAALVVLNLQKELLHRLWRGQATLLLPLVDHTRLRLCTKLTEAYGAQWPLWFLPKSHEEEAAVRENPLACQWGHIEMLLHNCDRLRVYQKWLPMVRLARSIRNDLAHYRPIQFHRFQEFSHEIEKLGITL